MGGPSFNESGNSLTLVFFLRMDRGDTSCVDGAAAVDCVGDTCCCCRACFLHSLALICFRQLIIGGVLSVGAGGGDSSPVPCAIGGGSGSESAVDAES